MLKAGKAKGVVVVHLDVSVNLDVVTNLFHAIIHTAEASVDQILILTAGGVSGKGGKGGKGGDCPILNLQLGPINLDVLGLDVATSQICLAVTAHRHEGLLGELLCGLANALNAGTLANFLRGLSQGNLATLLGGLEGLLQGALNAITTTGGPGNAIATLLGRRQSCPVLDLKLGPVDLNLLGLEVDLDNCANGPVTADITGVTGALLGDLLCQLTSLNLNLEQIIDLLAGLNLPGALARVQGLIGDILGNGVVTVAELQSLLDQLANRPAGSSLGTGLGITGAIGVPLGLTGVSMYMLRRKIGRAHV